MSDFFVGLRKGGSNRVSPLRRLLPPTFTDKVTGVRHNAVSRA
jgi:hypothetical protein